MLASDVKSYVAKRRIEIGQRIRAVREKKGLSQAQAAQVLGCTRVTYTRVELGQDRRLSIRRPEASEGRFRYWQSPLHPHSDDAGVGASGSRAL